MEPLAENVLPNKIMQIAYGAKQSEMLNVALEIGIFDFLETNGPSTSEKVEESLKLNPEMSKDFLKGLAAMEVLNRDD